MCKYGRKELEIKIKYFEGATKLKKISVGDWIDVYSNEDVRIDVGEMKTVGLGFAMELPEGYEAILAPRSSTFKKWGVIETNGIGIIDNSYNGDGDEWKMPLFCLEGKYPNITEKEGLEVASAHMTHTIISKGDKIGQFRIQKIQPKIKFIEVESLGNKDRGGFGTTGSK